MIERERGRVQGDDNAPVILTKHALHAFGEQNLTETRSFAKAQGGGGRGYEILRQGSG